MKVPIINHVTDDIELWEYKEEGMKDQCTVCHREFEEENLTTTHDDSHVCKVCLDEFYDTCYHCESIIDLDDIDLEGHCPACGNVV